jgi:hypothetical protein
MPEMEMVTVLVTRHLRRPSLVRRCSPSAFASGGADDVPLKRPELVAGHARQGACARRLLVSGSHWG